MYFLEEAAGKDNSVESGVLAGVGMGVGPGVGASVGGNVGCNVGADEARKDGAVDCSGMGGDVGIGVESLVGFDAPMGTRVGSTVGF